MRKGSSGLKQPVQIYNLNFAFSSSTDQKGSLIMKRVHKSTYFDGSHLIQRQTQEKDFQDKKKGIKEKVKEWFTFVTIVMDKVH